MGKIRTSRYLPNPAKKNSDVEITQRDVEIFDIVYQYPAISLQHLGLLFGNYNTTRIRVRKLLDAGYLLRSHAQHVAYWKAGINESAVHFISSRATLPLKKHRGYIFPKSDYERLAQEKVNYSHERNVADFHVRMTIGAKKKNIPYIPRKTFIQGQVSKEYQDKYPFKTNTKNHNWELCRFNLGNKQYLQPDDLFALAQDKVKLFFLEIDQNTVPNVSKDKRKTIQGMFERYIRVYRDRIFEKTYKVDNMRVLFVTESDAHVEYLRKLVKDAHEIFYFVTFDKIHRASNILDIQFLTNKGELRTLI
jgi:hypothetical protein